MIELVYFGDEHAKRAPGVVGNIYNAMHKEWITAMQVVEAVKLQMAISIRPASASEMRRVEALVALYEIGQQIAKKVDLVLDQEQPADVQVAKERAVGHLNTLQCPPNLLDKPVAPVEQPAAVQ